jgi:nucleotide-binding universal stress UspA family protein
LDVSPAVLTEAITAFGDPAEEISKIAGERRAGLIVVGLHDSAMSSARLGSVTYRVLCLAQRLVLALPPAEKRLRRTVPSVSADVVGKSAIAGPKRELARQFA